MLLVVLTRRICKEEAHYQPASRERAADLMQGVSIHGWDMSAVDIILVGGRLSCEQKIIMERRRRTK